MAGEGLRKLTVVVLVFLVFATGGMVVQTEGTTCYKQSPSFRGQCTSDEACAIACGYDLWHSGFCSRGSCICTEPC